TWTGNSGGNIRCLYLSCLLRLFSSAASLGSGFCKIDGVVRSDRIRQCQGRSVK
uniref:Tim44-like domain-containing protein n=1 Tax=Parascaris univalens TaxID=6257 RepID=A0A915BDW0_PARUN